jgi:protein-disulfide isomerase
MHLLGYAEELSLDTQRFVHELEESVYQPRVREDFMSGVRSGVNGTPAFFINGIRYDGSWDLVPLLEALEIASQEVAV